MQMEFQFWINKRKREPKELCRWHAHMDHETSPLPDTKMPKAKPIYTLMDTCLQNSLWWQPPIITTTKVGCNLLA
jgi:hypothetical protein